MVKVFSSSNSRYFVVQRGNRVTLYRIPASLWTKDIPDLKEVVGVGDRGDVFLRTGKGLFKLSSLTSAEIESVHWESVLLADNRHGTLGKVFINAQGTDMFAEVVIPAQSLLYSLRQLFGGDHDNKRNSATGYDHRLCRIGDNTRKLDYVTKRNTVKREGEMFWSVSPEFSYCVVAVVKSNGVLEFIVYRAADHSTVCEFTLPRGQIKSLHIDEFCNTWMVLQLAPQTQAMIVHHPRAGSANLPLEPGAEVINVWDGKMCWRSESELGITNFDGSEMCRVDVGPLNSFGADYYFIFDRSNSINLAMGTEDELIVTPIIPENLPIDAKRWKRVSDFKKEIESEAQKRILLEREESAAKLERYQELSNKLKDSLINVQRQRQRGMQSATKPVVQALEIPKRVKTEKIDQTETVPGGGTKGVRSSELVLRDIKNLRMYYSFGAVSKDEYVTRLDKLNEELLKTEKT